MTYDELLAITEPQHLRIFSIPARSTGSILLLSLHQPSYWSAIWDSPEWWGGVPDPVNRWSRHIIEKLAKVTGSRPHFALEGLSTHFSRGPRQVIVHDKALSGWPYKRGQAF